MWWDEVLTALMSTFSPQYILQWTRQCEVHPPLFYLLTKALSPLGLSDLALRLPWAMTGILHILAVYALCGRYVSDRAGVWAATLLAAAPLHILVSRQLRPYPLILLLQTLSVFLLRVWIERPRPAVLTGLFAVNLLTASLHYSGIAFVGLQALFVTGYFLAARPSGGLRAWLGYSLANCAACLPGLFFFQTITIRTDMLGAAAGGEVAGRLLAGLAIIIRAFFDDVPLDQVIVEFSRVVVATLGVVLLATTLGARAMWKRDRFLAALLLFMLAANAGLVVAMGQGFFRPRHLLPIYLPVFLFAGCALASLLPGRGPLGNALLIAVAALPFATASGKAGQLYKPDSYAKYKQEAEALRLFPQDHQPLCTISQDLRNALGWYLDRQGGTNPFRLVELLPDSPTARFSYLTESRLDALPPGEARFVGSLGPPSGHSMVHDLALLRWEWPRVPNHSVTGMPRRFVFEASPHSVFRDSHRARGIQYLPKEGIIAASGNGQTGELAYAFTFPEGPPETVQVGVRYLTTGPGNFLTVRYTLDEGPSTLGFSSESVQHGELSQAAFVIHLPATARRLVVTFALDTGRDTPAYPGGNLSTNGIYGVHVECLPRGQATEAVLKALTVNGLSHLEFLLGRKARWAMGPHLTAVFESASDARVELSMLYATPLRSLGMEILLNGTPLASDIIDPPQEEAWSQLSMQVPVRRGRNELVLTFDRYNRRNPLSEETFSPDDLRPLALILSRLTIGNIELVE